MPDAEQPLQFPQLPLTQLAAFSGSSDAASARLATAVDAAGTRWVLKQWRDPARNRSQLDRREELPAAVAQSPRMVTGVRCSWRDTEWLAQPWIDGVNVLAQIRIGTPQMVARCLDAGFGFADELRAASAGSTGVVHFDLAPSNVLWTGESMFLTDFEHWGLAPSWYNHVDVLLSFGSAANARGIRRRGAGGITSFCTGPSNKMAATAVERFARVAPQLFASTDPAGLTLRILEVVEQKALRQQSVADQTGSFSSSWRRTANDLAGVAVLPLANSIAASAGRG